MVRNFLPTLFFKGNNTAAGGIIKECEEPKKHGYAKGMVYTAQKNAWMDKITTKDWVEQVLKPYAATIQGAKLVLIDKCTSHIAS